VMANFLLKRRRYRFQTDLCLDELTEVSYARGVFFAKVRQLEGGHFEDVSRRQEVANHRVDMRARFLFPCRMLASASSGVLDACRIRLSLRMEESGGRNFRKLGYADVDLAEYAGAGPTTQRYILQPYDRSHRLDNSIVKVTLNVTLKEGDTIFLRPLTRQQPISMAGEDEDAGGGRGNAMADDGQSGRPSPIPPPPVAASSAHVRTSDLGCDQGAAAATGHSRESSSSTSAGYSSSQASSTLYLQQPQAGHAHYDQSLTVAPELLASAASRGSADTGYSGSLRKNQQPVHLQDQHEEDEVAHDGDDEDDVKDDSPRAEGRLDAETVVDELLREAKLTDDDGYDGPPDDEGGEGIKRPVLVAESSQPEESEGSLQLFVCEDGSVTFNNRASNAKDATPVLINMPQ